MATNSPRKKIAEVRKKEQRDQKSYGIGCLCVIGIVLVAFLVNYFSSDSTKTSAPKTEEELRKQQIERNFSAWDGSHRGLTEVIKKSMNDPNSYEHVETVYWDKGDHLVVKTTFRGKNAFGGVVKNWVMAKVGLDGSVVEVLSQGP